MSNKELYEQEIIKLLNNYKLNGHVNEFLNNMVHVGFGVEQITRGFNPFNYSFYSKDENFLRIFISSLKEISKNCDDVFTILSHQNYYFISCNLKSLGCKHITIYKGRFNSSSVFFNKIDLKHDFNYLAYDYKEDRIHAKDMKLFRDRVVKYNTNGNEYNWFKELFCENFGGGWASYDNL